MSFKVPYRHLRRLANQLRRLPGIGERGAWRIAIHVAVAPPKLTRELAKALISVTEKMGFCELCHNLAEGDLCWICASKEREKGTICVVEDVLDLLFLEKTGMYKGVYHVLGGVISPWGGVRPEDLNISTLMDRIHAGGVEEVILALSPTTEGEATAQYLFKLLKDKVKVSRLGKGVPLGVELEYADTFSLGEALRRRESL